MRAKPEPNQDQNSPAPHAQEAELRYRTLFEQSPDGIVIIGADGAFLEFNEATHRMLGYTKEDFTRLRISDISLQTPAELEACTDKLAAGGHAEFEARYKTRDGEVKHVYVNARAINLSGQRVLHSIWRDITDHKRVEDALRKSEKFNRDVLESVDEGFIVIDRDYHILSANKAYLDQVRQPLNKVVGKHCYEISHLILKPCFVLGEECAVKRTFETGKPSSAIHIHHDRDNDPIYVEIKSYPLKDESGNINSAIEIINNITEKRKLEEQLRHSQKMEAVGQLAGGVAHDFNNILSAIIGYGSLIKMRMGDDDPMKYNLQHILDAAERAANLTRSLLAFSRKEAISPKLVDLNKIVDNIEKLLRRLIGENIDMLVQHMGTDLNVLADSGQIEQVLMNLATNAKDAMPRGGCLTIRTDRPVLDKEFIRMHGYGTLGTYARILVSDTGMGMDEKTRAKIFEPFFTTKEVGKGTGLGLSIVYGIVKQHNGFITCESEPGKGSTFNIYLPIIKGEAEIAASTEQPQVQGGTETILIAEDDATVRTLLKIMLEQFGYSVIEAVDGEDAIDKFRKNGATVRLLILDVIMPKKNGKEVYDLLRKDNPGLKAIFSSGYTSDILHREGIIEEGLVYIPKPVTANELLQTVRTTLDQG